MDDGSGIGGAVDLAQKRALAAVALDQVDRRAPHDGEDEAGESGTAAKVDHGPRRHRHQAVELGRVEEVAAPYIGKAGGAHQIDVVLPLDQHRGVGFESCQACLGNARQFAEFFRGKGSSGRTGRFLFHVKRRPATHAESRSGRRRVWTSSAVSAAGVTPEMRAAAPRVAGRAARNLVRASVESPDTAS